MKSWAMEQAMQRSYHYSWNAERKTRLLFALIGLTEPILAGISLHLNLIEISKSPSIDTSSAAVYAQQKRIQLRAVFINSH